MTPEDEAQYAAIARNVKAAAVRQAFPQKYLATRVGMSESAWYRRMDGSVPWRYSELQQIARALKVSMETLTEGAPGFRP